MKIDTDDIIRRIGISGLMKLMPLSSKKVTDLSIDDVRNVHQVLGFTGSVSDDLYSAALALLQNKGIDQAADIIQSPDTISELAGLFQSPVISDDQTILQCPHCHGFFFDTTQHGLTPKGISHE